MWGNLKGSQRGLSSLLLWGRHGSKWWFYLSAPWGCAIRSDVSAEIGTTPEGFSLAAGHPSGNGSRSLASRWSHIPHAAGPLMGWGQRFRECVGSEENEGRRGKDPWGEGAWAGTVSAEGRNKRKWEGKKPLYIVEFNFWEEGEKWCLLRHLPRRNVYSGLIARMKLVLKLKWSNMLGRRWAWRSVGTGYVLGVCVLDKSSYHICEDDALDTWTLTSPVLVADLSQASVFHFLSPCFWDGWSC